MATKSMSDLRKLQRNQLARINKELIDSILAATDDGDEQALKTAKNSS